MRPRQFDDAAVIDAALALLDEGGPTALSVRSLAAALGVRPNSVYTYVADRAGLEAAIAEHVLAMADRALLAGPPSRWRSRIERFARSMRAVLLDHPGAVALLARAPLHGQAALDIGEGLLDAFTDAGLGPVDAARATYAVMVQVLGAIGLEVAETAGTAPMPPEAHRIAARAEAFGAVDLDGHPLTASATAAMAGWISETQFRWMLDRLLDGLVPTR